MPRAGVLYYEVHGPLDAPPLVLSAGLGGLGSYWAPNLPALTEHFCVVTYDHRGTGRSVDTFDRELTIGSMGDDVVNLLDALELDKVHFMGHALGGLIGLDVALTSDRIERLVVVNGWAELDPHTARCFDVRLELLRKAGPAAFLRAQPLFLYPAGWISAHSVELEVEERRQLAHLPPTKTIEGRIAALREWELWIDMTVSQMLVIGTEDDMLVPATASRKLADAMCDQERVRYASMKWGGHACNVTDPDTFNALVLEFLGS